MLLKNNKRGENTNINIPNNIQNNQLNQMTIIYNIDKNEKSLSIFGEKFVENNKNNCSIIINDKQRELHKRLNMKEKKVETDKLQIKLIELHKEYY